MNETVLLNYPVFDGQCVHEAATVVIENGKIGSMVVPAQAEVESGCFLIPGLIDGHTHLYRQRNVDALVRNGVTAICAVDVSEKLQQRLAGIRIWTSRTMAMGTVTDGRAYVESEVAKGADYIKVILEDPARMAPKTMTLSVLRDIVSCAHEYGRKVAAHAVSVSMVRLAVEAGVDILIHVPMTEAFPTDLAEKIAKQGMAIVPTLTMMQAFANNYKFPRYKPEHYPNAEAAVKLLHSLNVPILSGTDSAEVPYVPKVRHGSSVHHELALLVKAGLTPLEALQSATGKLAEVFGIDNVGTIAPGKNADLVLLEGRPDKNITDSTKIKQVWINGQPVL